MKNQRKKFYNHAFKASFDDRKIPRQLIEEKTIFTSQVIDSFIKQCLSPMFLENMLKRFIKQHAASLGSIKVKLDKNLIRILAIISRQMKTHQEKSVQGKKRKDISRARNWFSGMCDEYIPTSNILD